MKKLLGIVVLGLLWCNSAYAITQQEAIDKYFKNKQLETIEGVWLHKSNGTVVYIYKEKDKYICRIIRSTKFKNDEKVCDQTKGSDDRYYGKWYFTWEKKEWGEGDLRLFKVDDSGEVNTDIYTFIQVNRGSSYWEGYRRLYPEPVEAGSDSGLLDYWWALILIIAVTFFIYTQSGNRLKKIRKNKS